MQLMFPAVVSEYGYQTEVIKAARDRGWRVYYQPDWVYRLIEMDMRKRRRNDRDRPDPGWPDLVLVKPPVCLFAELKSATGTVRPEQKTCIADLRACGLDVRVWRPKDWADVIATLDSAR